MLHDDTPPLSSDSSDDEMLMEDYAYEVIDVDEAGGEIEDLSDNENDTDVPMGNSTQDEDAAYIFRGHNDKSSVFCCSLSKNNELAATGSEEDKALVWNTVSGEILFECTGHKDSVIFVGFNFNDTYLASADMAGTIKLWQVRDKACIWDTSLDDIDWMKWHDSANVLLAAVQTGEVYMFKMPEGTCRVFPQVHGDRAQTGVILPDGKRIALGYLSGMIRVLDLRTGTALSTVEKDPTGLHRHSNCITSLDCYTDNNLLISTSVNGKTMLSSANNGKVISILQDLNANKGISNPELNNFSVEVAAFCKDPTFPVAATGTIENSSGKVYIWDIPRQVLRQEIFQEGGVTRLAWTSTSILFTTGLDGVLRSFDARAGSCLRSFSGHKGVILDLYISRDEKKALTVSDDSTARIFDISSIPVT
ncbi:hypothetical protein DMN91_011029 [Ooceraea biroi]|uniref:Angio-associated migratory cell protein n=1 Tax=Ooceraea biroi TaxID=2015173 RepID=A0A026WTZ6_OOCBI|nr:angio-associated migratory cell protein [Ooceraea biroi]EZA59540.1 Angio-associated migratory cell protein [Ooceraea biroi]RLU16960.1 hypothetical protein DMN91_011029 [Ooceraea biroi]